MCVYIHKIGTHLVACEQHHILWTISREKQTADDSSESVNRSPWPSKHATLLLVFFIAHPWRSMTIHHWLLHILLNRHNNPSDPMLLHDIIKLCLLLSFWSRDPWGQKWHGVFCNNLSRFKPCNCPQCKTKWHTNKMYEELKLHQKGWN